MTPTLHTKRLLLRQPKGSDLDAYMRYCASDRARFVRGPFSAAEAFDKLASMIGHWAIRGFGRYVIEKDDAPIGHAGPLANDDASKPELTWTLWDGTCEGQGYATEAARAAADHCLRDLNWPQLTILIQPKNTGSLRIADRLGAQLTDAPAPDWYPGAVTYHLTAECLT